MQTDTNQLTQLPTQEQFQTLVTQANSGDTTALAALRQLLDNQPQLARQFGNLFEFAKEALIGHIAQKKVLLAESLRREAKAMERDLAGSKPTLLERLVARRVVLNWLQLQHVDVTLPEPTTKKSLARKAAAERAWAQSLKNLDLVRSRLVPQEPVAQPKKKLLKRRVQQTNGVPVNRIHEFVGGN